ncbi:MAG: hypothetical protein CVV49_00100 [Spirochaetae bacterium HGW-Spirochaetae-5]|nr:MAG: hypothetical protein CVV49_00100 [Spirochaetae bacterium HGW-Spirochaetae-5]
MAKKLDLMGSVKNFADKDKAVGAFAPVIVQFLLAGRISNKYLSNLLTMVAPAVLASLLVKDKKVAEFLAVGGMAVGGVAMIRDILTEIAGKETDPKKKATLITYINALGGSGSMNAVSGVSVPVKMPNGQTKQASYIPPAGNGVNRAAVETDVTRF